MGQIDFLVSDFNARTKFKGVPGTRDGQSKRSLFWPEPFPGHVFLICVVLLLSVIFSASARAQDWQSTHADDGAYVYGYAQPGNIAFSIGCNAPSAAGLPPFQVGAHEETPSAPFTVRLEIGPGLVPGYGQRSDVALWVNDGEYRLPVMRFNEMNGVWEAELLMTSHVITGLRQARKLVLAPGLHQAYQIPVDGMETALGSVMHGCINAWAASGWNIPAELRQVGPGADQNHEATAKAIGGATNEILTKAVGRRIAQICKYGLKQIDAKSYVSGDVDRDGIDDLLLDWAGVTCNGSNLADIRPFCGASTCSVDLYLSRTFHRDGPFEMLAIGGALVPNDVGGLDVELGRALRDCDDPKFGPGCITRVRWTGTNMEIIK